MDPMDKGRTSQAHHDADLAQSGQGVDSVAPTTEEVRMTSTAALRPIERRVLQWVESGAGDEEIARRFGRGPQWVAQVRVLANLDRPAPGHVPTDDERLRPLERRLLWWREQGADHDELSSRFRRSPDFLARVEQYAHYKLSGALAS
jgi:hypothetical protein